MPIIEVKAFERRINDESAATVVAALTDALCEALGEEVRDETWVIVEGVSPKRWGFGGSLRT
jgi:phenylpyruvate tautomerase PptA (4-oxalocrotonate tautomerase family)